MYLSGERSFGSSFNLFSIIGTIKQILFNEKVNTANYAVCNDFGRDVNYIIQTIIIILHL